jgi:hypothetical protein
MADRSGVGNNRANQPIEQLRGLFNMAEAQSKLTEVIINNKYPIGFQHGDNYESETIE